MPAFDYAAARETAQRLIDRFGQDGTVNRTTVSGGVVSPVSTAKRQAVRLVDMRREEMSDRWSLTGALRRVLTVSTEGVPESFGDITRSDTITVGGDELQVLEVHPFSPGGTVLYWEVHVGT